MLAGPRLAMLALGWLMVLLVLGTLAQAETGLFVAQQKYFSSWVLWLGPVPTPGGALTLAVLSLGLTLKMALYRWSRRQWGSLLTHGAVWVLLIGGFVSASVTTEGYLRLQEGEVTNTLSSYQVPELAIITSTTTLAVAPRAALQAGQVIILGGARLQVDAYFPNSQLHERPTPIDDGGLTQGALRVFDFTEKAPEVIDERNRPTLIYTQLGAQGQPIARRVIFQNQPIPQPISWPGSPSATLLLRPAQSALPFQVKLEQFEQEYHPGTNIARHYASRVEITTSDHGSWSATIRMNEPLRWQGYTLYQASFITGEAGAPNTSILAVVHNQGRLFPYVAGVLLCLGLLVQLVQQGSRGRIGALALVLAWGMTLASPAHAQTLPSSPWPATGLAELPIQHAGRIKPLGTYARITLQAWGGQSNLNTTAATDQLAEILFNPATAGQRPLFYLPSRALVDRLRLPQRQGRTYAYNEITTALRPLFTQLQTLAALSATERNAEETQLLTLSQHVQEYYLLSRSTSLLWPQFIVPTPLAATLGVTPSVPLSALQLMPTQGALANAALKVNPPTLQTAQALALAAPLKARMSEATPGPLTIIPGQWGTPEQQEQWYAPWQVLAQGQGSPQSLTYLATWQQMAQAYQTSNSAAWAQAMANATTQAQNFAGNRPWALQAELWLHATHPFAWAMVLCALALAALALPAKAKGWAISGTALGLATLVQVLGITTRSAIMSRPPVGTLYESLLFVAALITLLGGVLAMQQRSQAARWLGLGASLGLALHVVAWRFAAAGGDTLGVLTAVLETNFWLATHVLVITAGYGLSLLAGGYAHLMLLSKTQTPKAVLTLQTTLIAALLATALGTVLGGIWADQSWGRFWGWDPKENGALLLTLWLIWVLHGRLSNLFTPHQTAALAALTPCIVALSWLGVNLLGVGLHSYGFMQGTGWGLAAFVGGEILVVAWLYLRHHKASSASQGVVKQHKRAI